MTDVPASRSRAALRFRTSWITWTRGRRRARGSGSTTRGGSDGAWGDGGAGRPAESAFGAASGRPLPYVKVAVLRVRGDADGRKPSTRAGSVQHVGARSDRA